MEKQFLIIMISSFIIVLTTAILMTLFIFKNMKKNQNVSPSSSDNSNNLKDDEMLCPNCGKQMIAGYTLTQRGIFFHAKGHDFNLIKAAFSNQILKNTADMSIRFRPRENFAWHCPDCQIVTIDHSQMVEFN
ncbi:MAG TPA: PF20097 family protein [Candidatus Cloacimonadota bacterium]|nr:PF20097 family protein [Candidatus Cloacimonadota bacterium]